VPGATYSPGLLRSPARSRFTLSATIAVSGSARQYFFIPALTAFTVLSSAPGAAGIILRLNLFSFTR